MIERPDWAFDNPYDDDELLCDDCGEPLIEVEDEDGKRLHCESCDKSMGSLWLRLHGNLFVFDDWS